MSLIKKFKSESKKIKGCIQCYNSSRILLNSYQDYKKIKEKRFFYKNQIKIVHYLSDIIENKNISKVEIRIYTDKTKFKKKYNFTKSETSFMFKKNETRLFVHSFNIIKDKLTIIAQSWFKKQLYHEIYKLDDITLFLKILENRLNSFKENPKKLFDLFKYEDNIETLIDFIQNEITNISIHFIITSKIYR